MNMGDNVMRVVDGDNVCRIQLLNLHSSWKRGTEFVIIINDSHSVQTPPRLVHTASFDQHTKYVQLNHQTICYTLLSSEVESDSSTCEA